MDAFKNAALKVSGSPPQISEFRDFYIVDIIEGLGSLNQLADDIYTKTGQDFYYQVGWGNAASVLNDLSATGAIPQTIRMFVAVGSENWFKDIRHWKKLIKGFNEATKFSGASWNGGETQTLVSVIHPKSVVLAGSATGIIKPKSKLLTEERIKSGDRIILLSSSGVHTNGITLIRKIFNADLTTLSNSIKNKTIIYSPLINKLLDEGVKIHFASHITGHGWRKIMRSKRNFTYIIENLPKPQPIFQKIQQATGMSNQQMYGDYNMGAGFALFVPPKSVDKILTTVAKMSTKAIDAGYVEKGPRKVVIKPLDIEFKGGSLLIR